MRFSEVIECHTPARGSVGELAQVSQEMEEGLMHKEDFKGMQSARFYTLDIWLDNADGKLRPGMSGSVKIFAARRSLAYMGYRVVRDFVGRKIW